MFDFRYVRYLWDTQTSEFRPTSFDVNGELYKNILAKHTGITVKSSSEHPNHLNEDMQRTLFGACDIIIPTKSVMGLLV